MVYRIIKEEKEIYKNKEYGKRELRKDKVIQEHKQSINNLLAEICKINKNRNTLVVDGPLKRSRKTLINYGYKKERIYSIDKNMNGKATKNELKMELEDFLQENKKGIIYSNIFLDSINGTKKSVKLVDMFFKNKFGAKKLIMAITITLRGVSSREFGYFNTRIKKTAEKYDYMCKPIEIPSKFRIELRSGKRSKYNIITNMTDNGCGRIGRTGRTITAFYGFEKNDKMV
jgi:hypothetical protein